VIVRVRSDTACTPPAFGVSGRGLLGHHSGMTGSDIAMLALTFAGFALIAMLPYAAFRLVEVAEDAIDRARTRA
jgi:hypothetical protein